MAVVDQVENPKASSHAEMQVDIAKCGIKVSTIQRAEIEAELTEVLQREVPNVEAPEIESPRTEISQIEVLESESAKIEMFETVVEILNELEDFAATGDVPANAGMPVSSGATAAGADRRAHPRYAFTAAIEVATPEAGAPLKTRVRDLSEHGCYVDTDRPFALGTNTEVRITKAANTFEARARVVYSQSGKGMGLMFTLVPATQVEILDGWIAESRETSWLAANRRRSQRVLMKIPVRVSSQPGAALLFDETTHTVAISAHGASIVVAAPVQRGQRFTLANIRTKAALECVAVHVDTFPGEGTQVGVEFMLPNPTFWRVAFPPKDWTSRHPDAKSR